MDHPRLAARAPYDLLIANILAGPLIALAPALAGALAPRGRLILAGLLGHQAEAVASAYWARGMRMVARLDRGDWPTLVMRKRR
jgi:ribosomal protein L11 methyltransferase